MAIQAKILPLKMKGIAGGPRFMTDVIVGRNGQEVRNALWQDALWKFNLAYAIRSRQDALNLYAFFLNCRGRETPFLLQALSDYKIPDDGSSGTPQVITQVNGIWRIYKAYTDSLSNTYKRLILRPSTTASDFKLYIAGVLKTNGVDYTYSTSTGIITPISSFTGAITITLDKFYVICRFDIDDLLIDMVLQWVASGLDYSQHQIPDIPIVEVRDTA